MNQVAVKQNLIRENKNFRYTPEGLQIRGEPTFWQCEEELGWLKDVHRLSQFFIGDLLNYMEDRFGESYSQVLDSFDYAIGSLANMKSVAKAFPADRRRGEIPFAYYQSLQGLSESDQESLLDQVQSERITNLTHLRNKAAIIKKHSGQDRAKCEHNLMTICTKCGEIVFE